MTHTVNLKEKKTRVYSFLQEETVSALETSRCLTVWEIRTFWCSVCCEAVSFKSNVLVSRRS